MLESEVNRSLHRALLEAFTREQLALLLKSRIGISLDLLAPSTATLAHSAFEVVEIAGRAGWTRDLVRAAYEARPTNPALAKIYQELGLSTAISHQRAGAEVEEQPATISSAINANVKGPFFDLSRWRQSLLAIESRVCRVETGQDFGTGFLVGPDTVLTCYHNVESMFTRKSSPQSLRFRFDYRILPNDELNEGVLVGVNSTDWLLDYSPYSREEKTNYPGTKLPTDDELDYALIRLERELGSEPLPPARTGGTLRGWIWVPETAPELVVGMPLAIVQYAAGGPLKIAFDTKAVLGLNEAGNRVRYSTTTAPGSGGAPCFDMNWQLVAMHQGSKRNMGMAADYRQGIPIAAIRARVIRVGKVDVLAGVPPEGFSHSH